MHLNPKIMPNLLNATCISERFLISWNVRLNYLPEKIRIQKYIEIQIDTLHSFDKIYKFQLLWNSNKRRKMANFGITITEVTNDVTKFTPLLLSIGIPEICTVCKLGWFSTFMVRWSIPLYWNSAPIAESIADPKNPERVENMIMSRAVGKFQKEGPRVIKAQIPTKSPPRAEPNWN